MEETPKPRRRNVFASIGDALLVPDKAFTNDAIYTSRRVVIFAVIFVLAAVGVILTSQFHQNEVMWELSYQLSADRLENMLAGATEAELAEAKREIREQISGGDLQWLSHLSAVISTGIFSFLYVIEIWVILILAAPFFGADEEPLDGKKHKRSNYLAWYAAVPYGLTALSTGIILLFKDPASIGNVLTLQEYTRATDISFSLMSLIGTPDVHPLLRYLLVSLTNPIYLWGIVVIFLGSAVVLRIKEASKRFGLVAVVVGILALQTWLFEAIGTMFTG